MDNEKETKQKLLDSALKEFSKRGFMKASLRTICRDAGVTTGALYFFFKDKKDLFANIVAGPLKKLERIIEEHFSDEIEFSEKVSRGEVKVSDISLQDDFEDDSLVARLIIKCLFKDKKVFDLLLTGAQGSGFEDVPDRMVDKAEAHFTRMYMVMKGYESVDDLSEEDRFIIHWMSHNQVDMFIHMVIHCEGVRDAERQMKNMMSFMIGGWFSVINNK
ncbi:MAG: TetR family transcriptional regulator [Lachnospiraceae bacterium]|nr:TetR family transcriptional regulator [Lachnospiraceae bacterium]